MVDEICARGHVRTKLNMTESHYCKECNKITGRERTRERRAAAKLGVAVEEYRARASVRELMPVKRSALDYLKLSDEQGRASDLLNLAIDGTGIRELPCEVEVEMINEEGFSYYGYRHTDGIELNPPSVVEASNMCAGCPVIAECFAFGEALKAKNAVYGGVLRDDRGKPVGLKSKRESK